MSNEKPPLNMGRIQEKLDTLALATAYKIEREWAKPLRHLPFAAGFFGLTMRLARHTYRTVGYLCADKRRDEYDWRWEYTLCLPAINRTLVDSLFNTVFMLEDLESRSKWYHKSGWREAKLEHARCVQEYGTLPEWQEWLARTRSFLDASEALFAITVNESADPKNYIEPWPNPGRMVDYQVDPKNRPPSRQFLHYLNDWFYRELSAQSHTSFFGFMKLGALVMARELPEDDAEKVLSQGYPQHLSVNVARTVILVLSLISEIEHYFGFGLSLRATDIWRILNDSIPEAKEMFEKRYEKFWPVISLGV